jgi:OOP family OmpA-OmpF porin
LFCHFALLANAQQNLVNNPGFELTFGCPDNVAEIDRVKNWYNPTPGTPDYFSSCATYPVGMPYNLLGNQPAHGGNSYCGIICMDKYGGILEYLTTELLRPLSGGREYYYSMWVSLSDRSKYATNTIDACLSEKPMRSGSWTQLKAEPQVKSNRDSILSDIKSWHKVSATFIAKGGEKYLNIGVFTPEEEVRKEMLDSPGIDDIFTYYYIDDVYLVDPLDTIKIKEPINTVVSKTTPTAPGFFNAGPVYFDTDKYTISKMAEDTLNRIALWMNSHPGKQLEIIGYTDADAGEAYNRNLSKKRAEAVKEYFIKRGISSSLLMSAYKGEGFPAASNEDEAGKALNRRVEFNMKVKQKNGSFE